MSEIKNVVSFRSKYPNIKLGIHFPPQIMYFEDIIFNYMTISLYLVQYLIKQSILRNKNEVVFLKILENIFVIICVLLDNLIAILNTSQRDYVKIPKRINYTSN